jgi:hypothetical protein
MTAAHELEESGFLVQVVEAEEDPYSPGSPLVGGMAANQRARVRANVEDLHQGLIDVATGRDKRAQPKDRQVARCLLELFAFNRRVWLSTEKPARVRRVIYATKPDADEKSLKFAKSLVEDLKNARKQHREQWIWDLALRSVLVGDITPDGKTSAEQLLTTAHDVFTELKNLRTTEQLATRLFSFAQFQSSKRVHLRDALEPVVVPAIEREFLSFRLQPRVLCGFEEEAPKARALFKVWAAWLRKQVPHCSLSLPSDIDEVAVETIDPPPRAVSNVPQVHCWLEVDIIEQRLPGEHGFRFFPSFYRHVGDTMQRIPLFQGNQPTGKTVLDNLNPTIFQGIGFSRKDRRDLADPQVRSPATIPVQRAAIPLQRTESLTTEGTSDGTTRIESSVHHRWAKAPSSLWIATCRAASKGSATVPTVWSGVWAVHRATRFCFLPSCSDSCRRARSDGASSTKI